jgi:hypothetical protein
LTLSQSTETPGTAVSRVRPLSFWMVGGPYWPRGEDLGKPVRGAADAAVVDFVFISRDDDVGLDDGVDFVVGLGGFGEADVYG